MEIKKFGFTLSEVLVVLGLLGTISAITIPNLAYNYKGKVLEEQYRATYSELKEIGSHLNFDKGDVGEFALSGAVQTWVEEFMSRINGANKFDEENSNTAAKLKVYMKKIYKDAGGAQGPYAFNLGSNGQLRQIDHICDNWRIWSDSKGRIWTFNDESRLICVDINGTANPNRQNIDIFAFIPMTAEMVAKFVYNDPNHVENYSGQIIPCDLDYIQQKNLSNIKLKRDANGKIDDTQKTIYWGCPFFEPIENIAPLTKKTNERGVEATGTSARGKTVTRENNYWKDYINYK